MFLTSQKFVFAISTFVCYTPLLKYNPHTNYANLYLTQRFRHIFIDFPPLTPDALEPKTTLSRKRYFSTHNGDFHKNRNSIHTYMYVIQSKKKTQRHVM